MISLILLEYEQRLICLVTLGKLTCGAFNQNGLKMVESIIDAEKAKVRQRSALSFELWRFLILLEVVL